MATQTTHIQIQSWLPKRAHQAHKGDFGRVLVVAGSRSMCGAGFLCAKSALTAGAGLVYWALPASMQPAFAAALPEVITLPLPENSSGEIDQTAWEFFPKILEQYHPSLLVIGPGMGRSSLLPFLLRQIQIPMIIDADAINALAQITDWASRWPQARPAIFTPHAMEMARLLHTSLAATPQDRLCQLQELVYLTGGVGVFKGAPTLLAATVAGEMSIFENTTGGPALAKAGTGDVLSGVIAGLWAQLGMAEGFSVISALKASVCGVYLHGRAGDLAARAKSDYGVLASDVLSYLPAAFLTGEEGR